MLANQTNSETLPQVGVWKIYEKIYLLFPVKYPCFKFTFFGEFVLPSKASHGINSNVVWVLRNNTKFNKIYFKSCTLRLIEPNNKSDQLALTSVSSLGIYIYY